MNFGIESGILWAAIGALILFGIGYNALVKWARSQGYLDGYTALAVVAGVLVTLLVFGLVTQLWPQVLLMLVFFTASGTPMVAGDIIEHLKARKRLERRLARLPRVDADTERSDV